MKQAPLTPSSIGKELLGVSQSDIAEHPDFDEHEKVVSIHNDHLKAIIAVHNTHLGPGVGGCRMFPYRSHRDALADVLKLSRGMTYKSALAGLAMGGGKAVIIGDSNRDKTRELLLAMGDFVESLQGLYITAEDSGTHVDDIAVIRERTQYVPGKAAHDIIHKDPSPVTALGVFVGITEAVKYRHNADLQGVRVAIQGVGNVGFHLARMLVEAGALVMVADINQQKVARAVAELGVTSLPLEDILNADVDVLSPCALGGAIDHQTVESMRAGIIVGAANNQLQSPAVGQAAFDRGLLYAPDYLVNAGGVIDIHYQRIGNYTDDNVRQHVLLIAEQLREIFTVSEREQKPTHEVADELAEAIFIPERNAA